jgi:hypothetical protein
MNYKHTQIGYLMIFIFAIITLLFGSIFILSNFDKILPPMFILILLIIASFSTLSVFIDNNYLRIRFSYGIFRKKFLLSEIVSAKIVKNHWYYGWGIRLWFRPYMWIFNVSGFDAVEIILKNKKIYRIGTDEPKKLEQAIQQSII